MAPPTPPPCAKPTEPCDLELVARAGADTPEGQAAYGVLVARHRPALLRHLTQLLRNASDAQDAAQETFTRAYLALRRNPPERNVTAWFRVIATRVAYNHARAERIRRRYQECVEVQHTNGPAEDQHQYVQHLLEAIPSAERDMLILRHVEERSVEEIAHRLGIGVSAAKMRLLRARRTLLARHLELADAGAA